MISFYPLIKDPIGEEDESVNDINHHRLTACYFSKQQTCRNSIMEVSDKSKLKRHSLIHIDAGLVNKDS